MALANLTFGEIKQAVYDRMALVGVTPLAGTVTMVERIVNESLQKVASNVDWPGLLTLVAVTFSNTGKTLLSIAFRKVDSILDSTGDALSEVSLGAFDDFYRGDTTAGTKPTVYCVDAFDAASGSLSISTWPSFTSATGNVRGYRRPVKLTTDADIPELPSELHHLIVDEAVARLREVEESGNVQVASQVAAQNMGQVARPG